LSDSLKSLTKVRNSSSIQMTNGGFNLKCNFEISG
jgi:hypothetical protein